MITRRVVGYEAHKNEWYVVIKAYKLNVVEIFRDITIYCVSTLSLRIQPTNSMIVSLQLCTLCIRFSMPIHALDSNLRCISKIRVLVQCDYWVSWCRR